MSNPSTNHLSSVRHLLKKSSTFKEKSGVKDSIGSENTFKKEKSDSESFEHVRIKKFLRDNLPLHNDITVIAEEKVFGTRRADLYLLLKNKKKITIEIQHSPMTSRELLKRTTDYTAQDIHVLWIFNGTTFSRYPFLQHGIQMTRLEKLVHHLYNGRIYYVNALEEGLATSIYPLHFAPFQETQKLMHGLVYFKRSHHKKSVIPGKLSSLKLLTFRHEKLKLARFTDENVKITCKKKLLSFINNFKLAEFQKVHEISPSLTDIEKLLFMIMRKYEHEFGIHLIYDILKQIRLLKKNEFYFLKTISRYNRKNFQG